MNTKHTPGPWTATTRGAVYPWGDVNAGDVWVCCVHHDHAEPNGGKPDNNFPTNEQCDANTHLIAAAPDLLEALELVLSDLRHYVSTHGPGPDLRLLVAESAIKKARGR